MAQGNRLEVDVVANIRAAQKQIEALTSRPYTLNLNTKGRGFDAPLGKIKGQLGEFEKSLEASNARVLAFGASAGAIYAINTAFRETVKATIEVEKALKDINVILNLSDKSLGQFGKSLFDIAKNTGNSFATVATAATELSRQGLGVADTLKRTQDALVLTRLSGLSAADSVEAITASLNGFQRAALTSTQIINKLAAVDASFAVSSADLAEAIKRVGSSAEDAGVSFDQLIAIVTSAQQITARGGAVIGNSFKTIFTRLQRTDTLDALERLGIQTRTTEGNIRPLVQILTDLSQKYDTLNGVQKAAIAEQVGGVFQINILKAALGDLNKEYSIFSNALKISSGATNEAVRRNEELNTTLSALLNETIANLTAAGAKIGELTLAPAIKKVLGGVNSILENFTGDESEGVGGKIGEGLLKGIGNFLSGPGLLIGAKLLFGIFQRLTVFTADALKSLTGLNAKGAEQAQIQQQIFSILQKNPEIIAQINSGQTTLKGLQESILNTIKAQTLAMEQQVTLSKSLATSLASAGVSVSKAGLTVGRLQTKGKADGFVPNLFDQEEASARRMGAVNPKAQMSAGTIGGQKFIKNNKEVEIVGMGRNGDSAVIPTYGSIGDKRQKELFEKMQFLGFVPNFAEKKKYTEIDAGTQNKVGMIFPVKTGRAGTGYGYGKYGNYKVRVGFPISGYNPANIRKPADVDLYKQLGDNIVKFTNNFARKIFQGQQLQNKITSIDQLSNAGSFGSITGAVFESAVGLATSNLNEGRGQNAPIDFTNPNDKLKALFNNLGAAAYEAKVNAKQDQRDSTAQKILDLGFVNDKIKSRLGQEYIQSTEEKEYQYLKSKTDLTKSEKGRYSSLSKKIGKRRSSGFIPNFANIKDAMETEKRMGGNPALDFQEGIGLYVRDKDTQPNFAAVKRDHPEGIGQAIKNSRKAQESLARGFIPNFKGLRGAIGGAKSFVKEGMPDVKRLFSDDVKTIGPALKGIKDNALAASFGLSTLSGLVDEFNKDSKSAFGIVASEALKGASTFSTISSIIPGKIGLIVGAIVGTVQAIEGITKGLKDAPLNKIIEESKRSSESFARLNDATQKYATTFEKLSQLYAEGDPSKAGDIVAVQKELNDALMGVPPKYRNLVASATSLKELQDIYGKILKDEGDATKRKESGARFAEAAKKAQGGFFQEAATQFQVGIQDMMNLDATGIITALNAIPGQLSKALAEGVMGQEGFYKAGRAAEKVLPDFVENMSFVKSALGTGRSQEAQLKRGVFTQYDVTGGGRAAEEAKSYAMNLLGGLDEGFLKDLKSGKIDTSDPLKFIEALQNYKADPGQIEALKNILFNEGAAGKENIQLLIDQTKILGIEADATQKKVKELSEKMKKEQEEKKRLEEIERKAREEAARLAQELQNMSKAMINSSLAARKMAFTRKANNAEIATEAFQANLNAEQPLLTEKAMAGYQYEIKSAQTEQAFQGQMFSAGQEGITALVSNYAQAIENQIATIQKNAEGGVAVGDDAARIQQLQTILGSLSGAVGEGESADQVNANLQKIAAEAKLDGSIQNTLSQQIQTTLADSKAKQDEIIEENRKQTEIQKAQYKAQLRQIELQQNLKAFGGIEGFLNPESQKPLLDKLFSGFEGMKTGKEFGLEKMAARGTLQAAMATVELTGGTGSPELNEQLKGAVLPQMADSIRQEALDLAAAARATGTPEGEAMAQVYEKRATEAEKIAKDQYDNALKKAQLPSNVADIKDQMNTLTTNLSQDPLTQGFKAALDGLNLNAQFEKISQLLNINNDIAANAEKQQTLKKELSDLETGLKNEFGSVEKAQAMAAGGDVFAKQEVKKYEEKKQELEAMQKQGKNLETVRETKTKAEAKESRVTMSRKDEAEAKTQYEKMATSIKSMDAQQLAEMEGTFDKTYGGLEGARTAAAGGDKKAQEDVALYDKRLSDYNQIDADIKKAKAERIKEEEEQKKKDKEKLLQSPPVAPPAANPNINNAVAKAAQTPTAGQPKTQAMGDAAYPHLNKPQEQWTSADWKAEEQRRTEEWNAKIDLGGTPGGRGVNAGDEKFLLGSDKKLLSRRGALGSAAAARATGTPEGEAMAQVYEKRVAGTTLSENESQQKNLLDQRASLANKTDPASTRQREDLDKKLKDLRERNSKLRASEQDAQARDNPVKAAEERAKGRPSGQTSQADQGQKTERLAEATEKLAEKMDMAVTAQKESKNELNITFTPLSVDVKGTVETANDELNAKLMKAITDAVEQIAPGILAKLKGPPTETKA